MTSSGQWGWPDLQSADEETRLRSARTLRRDPQPEAVAELKQALAAESVRWVRSALKDAIEACEVASAGAAPELLAEGQLDDDDPAQAYADGKRDGLQQALHEISPLVGLARAAAEEMPENVSQEVRVSLEQLRTVTQGLRKLVIATAVPEVEEFDLSRVLRDLVAAPPVAVPAQTITARGPRPFVIAADPELVELAVRPLVANALEATLSLASDPDAPAVVVSWGAERHVCWIAVIDHGPGIRNASDAFVFGATDKPGHSGLGLSASHAAVRSLGGDLVLEANRHGGTTAVLRWPRRP